MCDLAGVLVLNCVRLLVGLPDQHKLVYCPVELPEGLVEFVYERWGNIQNFVLGFRDLVHVDDDVEDLPTFVRSNREGDALIVPDRCSLFVCLVEVRLDHRWGFGFGAAEYVHDVCKPLEKQILEHLHRVSMDVVSTAAWFFELTCASGRFPRSFHQSGELTNDCFR